MLQNLQVMGDGRRRHAAHGNDLATIHPPLCCNGLKDLEPRFVGKRLRNFLELGAFHNLFVSVTERRREV